MGGRNILWCSLWFLVNMSANDQKMIKQSEIQVHSVSPSILIWNSRPLCAVDFQSHCQDKHPHTYRHINKYFSFILIKCLENNQFCPSKGNIFSISCYLDFIFCFTSFHLRNEMTLRWNLIYNQYVRLYSMVFASVTNASL